MIHSLKNIGSTDTVSITLDLQGWGYPRKSQIMKIKSVKKMLISRKSLICTLFLVPSMVKQSAIHGIG